jgi:adenosylcobinamide-phosphate guanylyltransferase
MKIPCLIMAGGQGKRMGLSSEKPMLMFLGKPLVDWVAEAVASANKVTEFYIVTSGNTPETEQHCRNKGWKILRTSAKGYHDDLKQAVFDLGWTGPVLTLPADVPALTGKELDKIVGEFEVCKKDFLAVFVPVKAREKAGLSISSIDEYNGVWYAVSGINIINGAKIQSQVKVETSAIISEENEVLLNINTVEDLEVAEKIIQKR